MGESRAVEVNGHTIWTAIWKSPVEGRVPVGGREPARRRPGRPERARRAGQGRVRLCGRGDRAVGGGARGDHSARGRSARTSRSAGCPVSEAVIGERWEVGSALLEVAQPRLPCFKLGLRMGDPGFVRRFAAAGRPGAYLRVVREGDIGAGDPIQVMSRPAHGVTSVLVSRALLGEPRLQRAALGGHRAARRPARLAAGADGRGTNLARRCLGHEHQEALVVLAAGRTAVEVGPMPGTPCRRPGGKLQLDVAIELLEALLAGQLGSRRAEEPREDACPLILLGGS